MKEDDMETGTENEKEKKLETKKTGMQKFWSGFLNFLMYGGIIVVVIVIAAIVLLILYLTKQ